MLPRDKSDTTLSRSNTNSSNRSRTASSRALNFETPLQYVKGVGPKLGAMLASRGLKTVGDILYFFPRAYQDRSTLKTATDLETGETASLELTVTGKRKIPTRRRGKWIFEVKCTDTNGDRVNLKYFHFNRSLEYSYEVGKQLVATGAVKRMLNQVEMVHPEVSFKAASAVTAAKNEGRDFGGIIPVYVEIEGIPTRTLRKIIFNTLQALKGPLPEDLPAYLRERRKLQSATDSIRHLHFPPKDAVQWMESIRDFTSPWHQRLIYEEFFKFEFLILRQKENQRRLRAPTFKKDQLESHQSALRELLPFKLTKGQDGAVQDVLDDLASGKPMNRLLQGDVGSGKTVVSFLSAAALIAEGSQVVLMAPTEILAEQHYQNSIKLLKGKVRTEILTGKTPQSERKKLGALCKSGAPLLLIGTHALIEDWLTFPKLDLIMIDEQHRFGVEQRRRLRQKGNRKDLVEETFAHTLVLTATPIPRTLALTAFGDLSVSSIKERPPGRTPVETEVVEENKKHLAYEKIRTEVKSGRQAYVICPLVKESEAEGFTALKSALEEAERLKKTVFKEFKVGLLHGQLKSEEKAKVMEDFKANRVQILVSTTVIEVGVDVPNATVMAIEHAERFGLSQLHQLRGRVGRGKHASSCYLFTQGKLAPESLERLRVLEKTEDGFEIAESDLKIRGPGEFLGVRQSGTLSFKLGDLVRDRKILFAARDDVIELTKDDPNLEKPSNSGFRDYLKRQGLTAMDRFRTS